MKTLRSEVLPQAPSPIITSFLQYFISMRMSYIVRTFSKQAEILRAFAHARNPQLRLDKKACIVQVIPKTIIDHAFSQSSKLHLLPQNPEYQMLLTYLRITFCDCWDMMVKLTDRMMAVREGGFRGREVSRNLYQSR